MEREGQTCHQELYFSKIKTPVTDLYIKQQTVLTLKRDDPRSCISGPYDDL